MNAFNVFNKVNFMAVDNASVMKKACQKLNKEHIGCLNHLLNLIVKRFFNSKLIQRPLIEDEDDPDTNNEFEDIFEDEVDELEDLSDSEEELDYSVTQQEALKSVGSIIKKVKKLFFCSVSLFHY